MKPDELGAGCAADAAAMTKPLVPSERASPENAIHVSFILEILLCSEIKDERIAIGVASELPIRESGNARENKPGDKFPVF
jgi:hypothetical protein